MSTIKAPTNLRLRIQKSYTQLVMGTSELHTNMVCTHDMTKVTNTHTYVRNMLLSRVHAIRMDRTSAYVQSIHKRVTHGALGQNFHHKHCAPHKAPARESNAKKLEVANKPKV
jgi:hypothetical protein